MQVTHACLLSGIEGFSFLPSVISCVEMMRNQAAC